MRKSGHIFVDKHKEQRFFENLGLTILYYSHARVRRRKVMH